MRKFWLIFKQAFWTKARTKSFVITTILLTLGILLMANWPIVLNEARSMLGMDPDKKETLVVQTTDDALYEAFEGQLANDDLIIQRAEKDEAALKEDVLDQSIDAFVVLQKEENDIQVRYASQKMTDILLVSRVQEAAQALQTAYHGDALGLDEKQLQSLLAPIQFTKENISPSAKSEEELKQATILVYVIMFVIYFAVIMYAGWIAAEVAQEKSSRVMEILISSVSPTTHMFAKILGIGTLGILQMGFLGLVGFLSVRKTAVQGELGQLLSFSEVGWQTWAYGFIFFVLGYFLYATLAALLGSLVSRTEDVQQLIMPMTLLIIIAFLIAVFGINNPEAGFVRYASYFPFFTPLVMFLRVGLLDLPLWEPLLGIGIMLVTIAILGIFGAKVYRGGVLMYGPSRSLKDIRRAFRLGKE